MAREPISLPYQTRFPLVVASAYVIQPSNLILIVLVDVTASPLLAEVFTRLPEQPSHRLSKHVGRRTSERARTRLAITQPSEESDR